LIGQRGQVASPHENLPDLQYQTGSGEGRVMSVVLVGILNIAGLELLRSSLPH